MKVIVWERPDGGISVTVPSSTAYDPALMATAMQAQSVIPSDWIMRGIVEHSVLPTRRKFRNAWKWSEGVVVDIPKARALLQEELANRARNLGQSIDQDERRDFDLPDARATARLRRQDLDQKLDTALRRVRAATTEQELNEIRL